MLTGHERNAHILLHSTQSLVEQNKFHRIASAQNQVSDRSLATVQQWHIVDRSTPLELTFEGLDAHLTSGHSCSETSRLQRLALWHHPLLVVFDSGQPEAELVGKVVARTASAVAFDERRGSEIFEAGTGRAQRLTTALGSRRRVHRERIADPQRRPAGRAVRNLRRLRVNRDHVRRRLAHRAPGDVWLDALLIDRHHWNRSRRRQPVGFVVARRVVAHVVEVAEQERHGRESS